MKAMFNTRNKWIVVLCLFAELQCGVFKASNTGHKTLKITGKKHHDRTKETMKEKRFTMTAVPKGRVVYAYVTDRNRYVRPRRPRLYRAYIVRRPLIFRPRTTVNTVERQNIPYVEMQPTYPREELPRAPIITSQPWYYYQEQPAVLGQGLAGFSEPFPEEETFPEVPQEYSVHIDRCQPNPCYNGGRCRSHRNGRFKCLCRRGFNGRLCQVMRTKCKPNPCFNGGTCTDVNGGFECSCTFGYKGETCEQKAMCRGSPCLNGGSCTELDSEYQCSCLPGYRGRKCQEISYCYKSPCRNGGICMETESGFECICTAEWSCKDCGCTTAIKHSDTRDDCFPDSCLNGGTCLVTYHGFKCLCLQGYKGDICEAPEYCTSAPCLNGGTCKETNNGYNCLCKSRFRGPNCEVENHCRPKNPCSNGGLCVEEDDGYKCRCKIGYTGVNCEEKEPCVPNPCKNGGTCIAEQDGYSCMCQANFRGQICQIQEMCASNPCLHKGTCIDMDNNSFKCLCAAGWMGHNCEEKDSCIPNPCNNGGNCQRHGFTFDCKCALGYKGKHCEAKDPCSPNPCHNRGHCLARGESGFECKCGHEFRGFKCEKVNPCYPDPCTNGGTCKTIAESFNCACPLGRLGEFCEVSDPCFPNPCQNDGSCSALSHGGYHCTCVHAFVGALCAVPDPCMPSPCLNNGTCVNTGTTFHCRCAPGYFGSRCEHHSKCVPNPCLHDGTCRDVDLARGYVCYCSVAYLGPNCERTNMCYPHNPCQNGGTCKSDGTNQACHCVPGYLGSQCEQFNYCHSSPCKNDGTCTPKTNGFECECKQGFFGKKCETLSSHCFPNPCKNEGLCTEVKNKDGYMCICKEGFVGDNCERNDPCAPNPCQNSGTCLEAHTKRGYHCLCTPGWRGYVCDRQDICSPKSPCLHGGTCFNALDTFICHCPPRYTGNNCTTDKCDRCDEQANCLNGTCECKHGFVGNGFTCIPVGNPCQPNPCENGGTCNRGHGGKLFECVCKEGFTGDKCEVSKSACVSSPCVNGGTCVDATNNDGSLLEGVVFTNHSQYKCVCAKGYAGQNCQKLVLVNPCSTHPCVNNGTCFDDANSAEMNIKLLNSLDFRCFCPIGFSGIICQIPYSACKSSPCLHGGSCLDSSNTADVAFSANGYKCLCVEGFNGPNCEDVSESSSRPLAIPVLPQVTPQLPNAARTSAMAQKKEPNQLLKPVALTISPNIGATTELTKPSQSQIEVAVIPKVPERASVATNAGVPSSSGPPIVTILAPPNSIGNIPEAQDQSPSRPVGYLVPPSTVLKYVPSLNLRTASAKAVSPNIVSRIKSASSPLPSAVLIPSPAFQSSDESDTAAFPVVVQSPIIAMPPGMKPPPDENRLLNPASIKGAPRLLLPTLQENSHQRGFTYQTSNAGYYSHEPGDRNQLRQGYRKSPFSNIQGHFGYLYPENGYQTNVKAKGTLQRRYRHIEDTSHQRRRSLMISRN